MTEPSQPLTLSIWTEDGQRHDTVLKGPGGTIRFCIGDPDANHSATWRVWATPNTSDVFMAVRDIGGDQKFSLHENGWWAQQFNTIERANAYGRDERLIDHWDQPAEHGDTRLTVGFTVRARSQDLGDYPERSRPPKDCIWLPAAPEGQATVVNAVISRIQDVPVRFDKVVPFAGFSLADGRAVLLLLSFSDIPDNVNGQVDAAIRAVADSIDFDVMTTPRMAIHGNNEHGRIAWDVALRPEHKSPPT